MATGVEHLNGKSNELNPLKLQKEVWLRHFCNDVEFKDIRIWLRQEGFERPDSFVDRLKHAQRLRELGNGFFGSGDYRRALHCMLGALHSLDYSPAVQLEMAEEDRASVVEAMQPVLANLSIIFLRRGDFPNVVKAVDVALKCADKLPPEETQETRVKLLYRRALAKGEPGHAFDPVGACEDLTEAARLQPTNREVRTCLENCKELVRRGRREGFVEPVRYKPPPGRERRGPEGAAATVGGEKGAEAAECQEPVKLKPWVDAAAVCVGTCLGRSLRYHRNARSAAGRHADRLRQGFRVLVGPAVGLLAWRLVRPLSGAATTGDALGMFAAALGGAVNHTTP
mmetsp:Transcript_8696/g.24530  ORF Transcript_8696/g.24530 Transcript_8696/m.24530 type:complete len:341 (+) Transcript_8696:63-1085(+)